MYKGVWQKLSLKSSFFSTRENTFQNICHESALRLEQMAMGENSHL